MEGAFYISNGGRNNKTISPKQFTIIVILQLGSQINWADLDLKFEGPR